MGNQQGIAPPSHYETHSKDKSRFMTNSMPKYLASGLSIAFAANVVTALVSIWAVKTSTPDTDLWVGQVHYSITAGAIVLAFAIAFPLNVIAALTCRKGENLTCLVLAMIGCCLSLSPIVIPVIIEWLLISSGWF